MGGLWHGFTNISHYVNAMSNIADNWECWFGFKPQCDKHWHKLRQAPIFLVMVIQCHTVLKQTDWSYPAMSPVLGKLLCTECLCQRKTGSSPSDLTELALEGKEFPKETPHASRQFWPLLRVRLPCHVNLRPLMPFSSMAHGNVWTSAPGLGSFMACRRNCQDPRKLGLILVNFGS